MSRGIVRLAYVLLALMTIASFGGPFLIGAVLRGGERPDWPPDRPVEWITVISVTAVVVVVLIALALLWHVNMKQLRAVNQATLAVREAKLKTDADRGEV